MLDSSEEFLRDLAVLAHLRTEFPSALVTLVCGPENVPAAQGISIVDEMRPFTGKIPSSDHFPEEDILYCSELCRGEFDIAIDLTADTTTRPILQDVDATLRCGIGTRRQFPFLDITLPHLRLGRQLPPIAADDIRFGPSDFQSRMPTQTPFFHETDFSISDTHVIYGPYARLSPGMFRATFAFELRAPLYCASRSLDLVVDVVRDHGKSIVGSRRLRNLPNRGLSCIPVEFTNRTPASDYEFRVFLGGHPRWTKLRFFGVDLVRMDSRNAEIDNLGQQPDTVERLNELVTLIAVRTRELATFLRERTPDDNPAQRKPTCALTLYPVVRSALDLVPEPPAMTNPPRFSVLVLDDLEDPNRTEVVLAHIAQQTLLPHETFLITRTDHQIRRHTATIINALPGESAESTLNDVALRATGTHLLIVEAGAMLSPKALAWFAFAIETGYASFLYSDVEIASPKPYRSDARQPVFQPAFDYELLLQRNYIGKTFCIARDAYIQLGGLLDDRELDPWHDLLLRATERLGRGAFLHVPALLAAIPDREFTAASPDRTIHTVQSHIRCRSDKAVAVAHEDAFGRNLTNTASVLWPDDRTRRISVIIPTRDSVELVFPLISSLRRHASNWSRVDVTVVVNGEIGDRARLGFDEIGNVFDNVRIVFRRVPFNWCEINNNAAAEFARGEFLVFLNDDIVCLTPSWDARVVGQLMRENIGLVGARLLYPDGSLQHAGVAVGENGATAHEAMGDAADDGLYRDRTLLVHGSSLLTGAFLACRRSVFEELHGFDAERYAVTSGDADFCLRVQATGRNVIYDPMLTCIHFESVSRGYDQDDYRKKQRADAEHALWRSRFSELDLLDLSGNPHLAWSPRPYDSFHHPGQHEIVSWLEAQARRAARWDALKGRKAAYRDSALT